MSRKILFLTLKTFSATGGIEKVCRIAGKALNELYNKNFIFFSLYDNTNSVDEKYFPAGVFKGFNNKRFIFILSSIFTGLKSDIIILSHINLLFVGYLIKLFSSKKKLVLLAHGIEIWKPLSTQKLRMLNKCDMILAVSNFTKDKIISVNKINADKCLVLNNCLDPFLPEANQNNISNLYTRYNLSKQNFILLTLTRIAADEKYKGHEKVIDAMGTLIKQYPHLRYIIAGKYDSSEKERLDTLIEKCHLTNKIIFTGYVADNELPDHYNLADVYVMPSSGEGFGLVFIEAMYYGLRAIAGNKDGSVDAMCNGQLGLLIDPENTAELADAIAKVIIDKNDFVPNHQILMQHFGYDVYKKKLKKHLQSLYN